jgi:hypothetical protein
MVDLSGIYYLYRFLGQGGTFEWSWAGGIGCLLLDLDERNKTRWLKEVK